MNNAAFNYPDTLIQALRETCPDAIRGWNGSENIYSHMGPAFQIFSRNRFARPRVFWRMSAPETSETIQTQKTMGLTNDNPYSVVVYPTIRKLSPGSEDREYYGTKYLSEPLTKLFYKLTKHHALFYINPETKRTFVIIEDTLTPGVQRVFMSLIPDMLPWFFEEHPLSEAEIELIKWLRGEIPYENDPWEKIMHDYIVNQEKIKREKYLADVRKTIGDYQTLGLRKRLDKAKAEEQKCRDNLEAIRREIEDYCDRLQNNLTTQIGLEEQIKQGSERPNELTEFLTANKSVQCINLEDAANGRLHFLIRTVLDNYDPEYFEKMYKNPGSYLYVGYNIANPVFEPTEARKKLIYALFGENSCMKIKIRAYFNLRFQGGYDSVQKYNFPPEYNDCLTNPHFYFFKCFGNAKTYLHDATTKGDMITAISICIAQAQNLNLTEGSQTVAPFLGQVFNSKEKIILMPDGSSATPEEAYHWLLEQETKTTEDKKED